MKTALIAAGSAVGGGILAYFALWLWALREFMK